MDPRWNVAPKSVHVLFFLVVGDIKRHAECVFLPGCQESQGTERNFAIAKAGKSRILVGANIHSRLAPKKYWEILQAEKLIM